MNPKYPLLKPKSADALRKKEGKKILFSTGLGVNKAPGLPVRFGAYLMPLIDAVRSQVASRGQFYIADQAALRIGQSPEMVERNVESTQQYVRTLVETCFPEISGRIDISREKREEAPEILERRKQLRSQLIKVLLESGDKPIIDFAKNRVAPEDPNGILTPMGYMAEHGLFMRDQITDDKSLFLIENPDFEFEIFAMIGGPAEEIFYKARTIILRKLKREDQNKNNLQLFTDIGRLPPYYSRKQGEPMIGEELGEKSAKDLLERVSKEMPELFTDYFYLIAYLAGIEDLREFSKIRNQLTVPDYERLQPGMEKLSQVLNQLSYENV